jgi:hypothetical protein
MVGALFSPYTCPASDFANVLVVPSRGSAFMFLEHGVGGLVGG